MGGVANKTPAYGIVPLSEVERAFVCIFLTFAFVFRVRVLDVCFCESVCVFSFLPRGSISVAC